MTGEDWASFKAFLDDIQADQQFQDIQLMVLHLYIEGFFRFTIKCKKLALDFGTPENVTEDVIDPTKSSLFWKDVQEELIKMQYTDVAELKQLAAIRDKALEPFDDLLPEKVSINEALESFETIRDAVSKLSIANPKKASRKEMIQTCKDYINQSHHEVRNLEGDSDVDFESITSELSKLSKKKKKRNLKSTDEAKKRRKRSKKLQPPAQSTRDDESENEFKQMSRKLGFSTQKLMLGIGSSGTCSEKLKKYYE